MSTIETLINKYTSEDVNTIKTFGFILYTDSTPNIKKMLRDEDLYASLNERSGGEWVIFTAKPNNNINHNHHFNDSAPADVTTTGYFIDMEEELNVNKEVIQELGLDLFDDIPALIIITKIHKKRYLQCKVKIDDSTVETSYNSLCDLFTKIGKEVTEMKQEYKSNKEFTHNRISVILEKHKAWNIIKKAIDVYTWIKGLLP